jgi:hypothetical protein
MTQDLLNQITRINRVAGNCGWETYTRETPAVCTETANKDPRYKTAAVYLSQLFSSKGRPFIEISQQDKLCRTLPQFMAHVALSEYGFSSASVINIKEAAKSDDCTEVVSRRLDALSTACEAKIVIPDFRYRPSNSTEQERWLHLFKVTEEAKTTSVGFVAILHNPAEITNITNRERLPEHHSQSIGLVA